MQLAPKREQPKYQQQQQQHTQWFRKIEKKKNSKSLNVFLLWLGLQKTKKKKKKHTPKSCGVEQPFALHLCVMIVRAKQEKKIIFAFGKLLCFFMKNRQKKNKNSFFLKKLYSIMSYVFNRRYNKRKVKLTTPQYVTKIALLSGIM